MNKPEEYLSLNTYQGKDAKEVLVMFKDHYSWSTGEKVIDIGSGPGNVTTSVLQPILPPDATIVGLDTSSEMIDFATRQFGSRRVSFEQVDVSKDFISSGKWEQASYDKIFSFYCLNFIHDQEQTARNMSYLLKKNGFLTLLFCGAHPFYEVYELLAQNTKWTPYIKQLQNIVAIYQHIEDPSPIYSHILKEAGFDVIFCKTITFNYVYPSIDDLMRMYAAVNAYSDHVPKEKHDEYLLEVKRIMIEKKMVDIRPSGAADLSYRNVVVLAKKR